MALQAIVPESDHKDVIRRIVRAFMGRNVVMMVDGRGPVHGKVMGIPGGEVFLETDGLDNPIEIEKIKAVEKLDRSVDPQTAIRRFAEEFQKRNAH